MSLSAPQVFNGTTDAIEEREVNSEWGQIWVNGYYQQDITAFTGTASVGQTQVPVAGQDTTIYRTARKTRTGTLNFRKADSRWEDLMLTYLGMTADDRRALRAQGLEAFPQVQLLLVLDDPDSWGAEIIQLNSVRFWEIPLGYSGSDLIERSMSCTWTSEQILQAIARPGNKQGVANALRKAIPTTSSAYTSGKNYGAFGQNTVF
jgi:hypothetical protein